MNRYLPFDSDWQMEPAERLALIALLDFLRPRYSLEIGTKYGGSLAVLSHYSERVISLDLDFTVSERLKHFTNVEFVVGRSQDTLPTVLSHVEERRLPLGFALIDGEHTAGGVRKDCQNLLNIRPPTTLYVMMHDSFNPDVREGLRTAGWEDCPYVQALELDFVPGWMFTDGPLNRQMWGGFALAVLGPDERKGKLEKKATLDLIHRSVYPFSVHSVTMRRVMRLGRLLGLRWCSS